MMVNNIAVDNCQIRTSHCTGEAETALYWQGSRWSCCRECLNEVNREEVPVGPIRELLREEEPPWQKDNSP